ncbi:MAG: hypothetical protein IJJ38_09555 [Lachnospiraceae bacterium]|nr:hypothetical protein [Lachnospiraceae bacterium]
MKVSLEVLAEGLRREYGEVRVRSEGETDIREIRVPDGETEDPRKSRGASCSA